MGTGRVVGSLRGQNSSIRVLGVPAFRNHVSNPYNALLSQALVELGAAVDEATPSTVIGADHDIVHVHWPEYLFCASGLARSVLQAGAFIAILSWLRARGTRVVWTVHNLTAHDRRHPRLEERLWHWYTERVDGYIALSDGGRDAVLERFPGLAGRPGFVIPHGHYRGAYPDSVSRDSARKELALPPHAHVVAFFGAIRPYKNVPSLIAAFRSTTGRDRRLVVAGGATDRVLRDTLRRLASGDSRIRLDLGFVPPDRVQVYLRAADLLVFPYLDILNSGSALLALSFDRPVLVPGLGAMADLRAQVGTDWVQTYDGALTAETLQAAMAWARHTLRSAPPPLEELEWDRIARQTLRAYCTVRHRSCSALCNTRNE